MIKTSLTVAVAAMLSAGIALAQAAARPLRAHAAASSSHERRQALVEEHMASEAALTGAERAAVAAVRADLARSEAQQRAAVKGIRGDYRALTADMTAKHAKELDAALLQPAAI